MQWDTAQHIISTMSSTSICPADGTAAIFIFHLFQIYTHTHSVLTAIFSGEPGYPLNSPSPFIPGLCILLGQAETFHVSHSQHNPTRSFFGHPLCLIPSTSHVIQRLTQSLSSFCSTCPNHLNLLFLIIKLNGSNPKSSLSSSLFFLSYQGFEVGKKKCRYAPYPSPPLRSRPLKSS